MRTKHIVSISIFSVALVMSIVSIWKFGTLTRTSASVIKKSTTADVEAALPSVVYNNEEMYVAEATFYDYYSDSQIGSSEVPKPITDGKISDLNTYSQFNKKLLELMNYGDEKLSPAKYPLYQGKQGYNFNATDMQGIYWPNCEEENAKSNYWLGANNAQVGNNALQGLVDSKLVKTSDRQTYITQSNPDNGKTAFLPYFDKKFLTTNKYNNSKLSLGEVKERVAFPFRKVDKNGITYYEFDSTIDTVRFNENNQLDYLGENNKAEQVLDIKNIPGFFPYNTQKDSNSNSLNFAYGTKIEVPFIITKDGKINGKDMIFEFTGDDDVWVFIDGILALDLGGAHPKISGTINFAEGASTVSSVKNPKVALAQRNMRLTSEGNYSNASLGLINEPTVYKNHKTVFTDELKNKLKDTTETHTLTLFYLERGKEVANMKMNFNLIEPTKYTVANDVTADGVGEAFKEEAMKVADKEEFIFDIVDKTTSKSSKMELKNKDYVLYLNEFDANDNLLTQQRTLKNEKRKMSDLYITKWVLKDQMDEIATKSNLIVSDGRTTDSTSLLFKNLKDEDTPVLTATYTNTVKTNKLMLACTVSDKAKTANQNYKNVEFKYLIKYSNVFGGDSKQQVYKGAYKVYYEDGTSKDYTTQDGTVTLKDGEKAIVEYIPILTNIEIEAQIPDTYNIAKLRATSQYECDGTKGTVKGCINVNSNIIEYVVGSKEEIVKVEEIKSEKTEDSTDEKEVVEVGDKLDNMDNTPKTSDETDIKTWLLIMAISLILTAISGTTIINQGKKIEE